MSASSGDAAGAKASEPSQEPAGWWARFETGPLLSMATALMLLATLIMLAEGFSRAALDTSYFWAEESVRFLMIWAFFLSLSAAGRRGHHIRTDMLPLAVGGAFKRAMDFFATLAGLGFAALLAWASWPQLHRYYTMGMVSESSLELPEWIVFLVMPIGAMLFFVYYFGGLLRVMRGEDPFAAQVDR